MVRREILAVFEGKQTREATPIKIGLHAFQVNLYLQYIFLAHSIFWPPWTIPWSGGNLAILKASEKWAKFFDAR